MDVRIFSTDCWSPLETSDCTEALEALVNSQTIRWSFRSTIHAFTVLVPMSIPNTKSSILQITVRAHYKGKLTIDAHYRDALNIKALNCIVVFSFLTGRSGHLCVVRVMELPVIFSAPGKVILHGEHAVVYGKVGGL